MHVNTHLRNVLAKVGKCEPDILALCTVLRHINMGRMCSLARLRSFDTGNALEMSFRRFGYLLGPFYNILF